MPVLVEATSVIIKRSAIDEKWPGGFTSIENGQCLCSKCNLNKSDRH